MPAWADSINSFIRPDYQPYYGVDRTLDEIPDTGTTGYSAGNATNAYPSTARSITQMPYKPKPRVTRKGRGRTTSGGKGPARPRARVNKKRKATKRGSFKKAKRVKRISPKYHRHRYEQEGTITAGAPSMYFKVNTLFKRDAFWDALADTILRPILAKECKFYPKQDTDKIGPGLGGIKLIVFGFKRVRNDGENQVVSGFESSGVMDRQKVELVNKDYDDMRQQMSTMLQTMGDGSASTAPNSDTVANFPCKYVTSSRTAFSEVPSHIESQFEELGDLLVDIQFKQRMSFQNKTLADGGGEFGKETARTGLNPLKGKVYELSHTQPRIRDNFDMSGGMRNAMQQNPANGMQRIVSTAAEDKHLAHPLDAKYWLKNCVREASISIPPAGTKSHTCGKHIKGKLSTIIENFYYSGFDKGSFGSSTLFMFDMVHKSDMTPILDYKRSTTVLSHGTLKSLKIYVPDFELQALDFAA